MTIVRGRFLLCVVTPNGMEAPCEEPAAGRSYQNPCEGALVAGTRKAAELSVTTSREP